MANGFSLTEIIISELGKPYEPFGSYGLLSLGAIVAAYVFFEYGLGRLVSRLFRLCRDKIRRHDSAP